MFKILKEYHEIITSWKVIQYEREGTNFRFKMEITFLDGSKLFVKDYLFEGNDRKYSFHWLDQNGSFKVRWDNSKHWRNVSTFPHHKHIGAVKNVTPSVEVNLEDVLRIIRKDLSL